MPMLFPLQQGFCFSTALPSAPSVSEQTGVGVDPCSNLLLSELLGQEKLPGGEGTRMTSMLGYPSLTGYVGSHPAVAVPTSAASNAATTVAALSLPGENDHAHGVPEAVDPVALGEGSKSTVFINDVAFQVSSGPFNVCETFGDDVVLINSAGQLVVTDQWGVILQSLQHGASFYLI